MNSLFQLYHYFFVPQTWFLFFCGLIIGSFLNVCIVRIPLKNFWLNSRSICPQCLKPIPFFLNIPVLSFILLKGRTRCCNKPLSWQYPLVELFTGILFVLIYWEFPFIKDFSQSLVIDHANFLRFAHLAIFSSLLLVCSVIDLKYMVIPDVLSLSMIAASPLVVFLHPNLDWKSSLIGVVAGAGVFYIIAWLYWLIRRQAGLGFGDVKLLAAIGGWLGYQAILPTIFIASLLGSAVGIFLMVVARKLTLKSKLPFGPFLAAGAVIYMLIDLPLA